MRKSFINFFQPKSSSKQKEEKKTETESSSPSKISADEKSLFLEQFRKALKEENHEEIKTFLSTIPEKFNDKSQLQFLEEEIKMIIHSGKYEVNFLSYIKSLIEKEYEVDNEQGTFLRAQSPAVVAIQYYAAPYFEEKENALIQNIIFTLKQALCEKKDLTESYGDYLVFSISFLSKKAKNIIFLLYDTVSRLENSKPKNSENEYSLSASKYALTFFFVRMIASSFPNTLSQPSSPKETDIILRKLLLEFPPTIFISALSDHYDLIDKNIKDKIHEKEYETLLLTMRKNLTKEYHKELKEVVDLLDAKTEDSSLEERDKKEQRLEKYSIHYKKQGSMVFMSRTASYYKRLSLSLFAQPGNEASAKNKEEKSLGQK